MAQAPPKRRIAPIPVTVPQQPATVAVYSPARAPSPDQNENDDEEDEPGRRLVFDISQNNLVDYQAAWHKSMKKAAAKKQAKRQAAAEEQAAKDGKQGAGPTFKHPAAGLADNHNKRNNTYLEMLRSLEARVAAGELSGGSDDPGLADDSVDEFGEGEVDSEGGDGSEGSGDEDGGEEVELGEDAEADGDGSGDSSEAEEEGGGSGDDGEESSDGSTEEEGGEDADGAGTVAEGGERAAAAGAPEEGAADAPKPRARRPREERYEADFIDDSSIALVKPRTVKTVLSGFFINKGDVAVVEVDAPAAPPRRSRAASIQPQAATAQQSGAAGPSAPTTQRQAAASTAAAGASSGAGKRPREEKASDAAEKKVKQRRTTQANASSKAAGTAAAGAAGPEPSSTVAPAKATAPVPAPAPKLSMAQLAAQAGKAAGTSAALAASPTSPSAVHQPHPTAGGQITAPAAPAAALATVTSPTTLAPRVGSPTMITRIGRSSLVPTAPAPGDEAAPTAAAPAAAKAKPAAPTAPAATAPTRSRATASNSVDKTLEKLKTKLSKTLSVGEGGAVKPLRLKSIKNPLQTLGLACYMEHSTVSEDGELQPDEAAWKALVRSKVCELLGEGRVAALKDQDEDSLSLEIIKVVAEQESEYVKETQNVLDYMKQASMTAQPGEGPKLCAAGCAALSKLLEVSRKLLPNDMAKDTVLGGLVERQLETRSDRRFTQGMLATQLSQHSQQVAPAKALKSGGSTEGVEAGHANMDSTGPEAAGALSPAPVAKNKPRDDKAASLERTVTPPPQPVARKTSATQPPEEAGKAGPGAGSSTQAPTDQGVTYQKDLSPQEEEELFNRGKGKCNDLGIQEELLREDWKHAPKAHAKAVLVALILHGKEGATMRQIGDLMASESLIPGWTTSKQCHDRLTRVTQHPKMKELMQPIQAKGLTRYSWRHMPDVVFVARKASKASKGDKGGETSPPPAPEAELGAE